MEQQRTKVTWVVRTSHVLFELGRPLFWFLGCLCVWLGIDLEAVIHISVLYNLNYLSYLSQLEHVPPRCGMCKYTNCVLNVLMIHSYSLSKVRRSVASIMFTQTSKTLCLKLNSVIRHLEDSFRGLPEITTTQWTRHCPIIIGAIIMVPMVMFNSQCCAVVLYLLSLLWTSYWRCLSTCITW